MQRCPLKSREVRLSQVEPRGICRRPVNAQAATNSGREFTERFLMSTEIVHNKMNGAFGPGTQHVFFPKALAGFRISGTVSFSDGLPRVRRKSTQPLQGSISLVSVWSEIRTLPPCLTAARDSLQRSHLVEANNVAPSGTFAIDSNYSVFFTSNSGSLLSHHVCPVRKLSP